MRPPTIWQTTKRNPFGVAVNGKLDITCAALSLEYGRRPAMGPVVFEPNAGLKPTSLHRSVAVDTGATPLASTLKGSPTLWVRAALSKRQICGLSA